MQDALLLDRLQFAFTITFHYLFPQLTMGLALLLVYFRTKALRSGRAHDRAVAQFWTKVFALSFGVGVVTGIPLEFQFGTNWARFSAFAGGVIGQTLAMEGLFAFFLESSFIGILLYGEGRFSDRLLWGASCLLFIGSWLSGYFILATNAWMQHPVAYVVEPEGRVYVESLVGLLTNPHLFWQYTHNMTAAVVTGSGAVAGVGAAYLLAGVYVEHGKTFVRTGVLVGVIAVGLMLFPTGHENARQVFEHQPIKGAAMEGLFATERGADLLLVGQPNMETLTIDNPIRLPAGLSFLLYDELYATVKGLEAFPREDWPDNIPLLYYAYHIMVTLGVLFFTVLGLSALLLWRGVLFQQRAMLWCLLLMTPFPWIATSAGWMTAELGRQPWLVYGLLRTADGTSPLIHSGNALFTLLGFIGIYLALGLVFLFLVGEIIWRGPASTHEAGAAAPRSAASKGAA